MTTEKRRPGVLIVVENLSMPADRRVWTEAQTLVSAGYRVSTISPTGRQHDKGLHERRDGVEIYRYPAPPLTSGALSFLVEFVYCWLATLVLSVVIAVREGFDIFQACNPPETFWIIGRLYQMLGKRFIFDHHDLSPEMYEARFEKKGALYKVLLWLERMTYRSADALIAVNEHVAQIAGTRCGVPPQSIAVVRSGPDPEALKPLSPDTSLKGGRRWMVCFLGVMNPQDGVDVLIGAADHLVHQLGYDDVLFALMGDGDSLEALRTMCKELGLERHVRFTGWADMDMIRAYLSVADVCVDPIPLTAYSKFGAFNKIMEYMSMARPIVAFDLPGTRWMAEDAALYAQPNDTHDLAEKIACLLRDEELRRSMGQKGRRRIEEALGWPQQSQAYLQAYDKVVHRNSDKV